MLHTMFVCMYPPVAYPAHTLYIEGGENKDPNGIYECTL